MSEITKTQWRILFAAHLGWLLDGFDVMLYAFAIPAIKKEFNLSLGAAGLLASATLISSAAGGIFAGYAADRWGRTRVLVYSILFYSVFTGLTATAYSVGALLLWRILVGLGLGGEWSAGSVLVAESWPSQHRGKAMGFMQAGWALGYILAALATAFFLPRFGWRILFLTGILPALFTFWIRRQIPESKMWVKQLDKNPIGKYFRQDPLLRKKIIVATSLASACLFAYWGLFTWIPSYLSMPRSQGGAGLSVVNSVQWIIPMEIGAFFGYLSFGFLGDWFGRRRTFFSFVVFSAILTPLYGSSGNSHLFLFILGPMVGFFGHGYFSLFGALLAELFPLNIRATAQGLCYNLGRALSATAPYIIGSLAEHYGVGAALSLTSFFYLLASVLIFRLPETLGEELA